MRQDLDRHRGATSVHRPGLFVINSERTVSYISVQSMPFVRPSFRELRGVLDLSIDIASPA
jgi:hypothetical protein